MGPHKLKPTRACPICGVNHATLSGYAPTLFHGVIYFYLDCKVCQATFVNPVPDSDVLAIMYAKQAYHDVFYEEGNVEQRTSALWVVNNLPINPKILDYGCGNGLLLKEMISLGCNASGVDFGQEIADSASLTTGVPVVFRQKFSITDYEKYFDAIVLRDVIEHLTDPYFELNMLLRVLKNDGFIFVEGPLEKNKSIVYLVSFIYRKIMRNIRSKGLASHPPYHLYLVNQRQQRAFFSRFQCLKIISWEVYETGWPYSNGGFLKRLIALVARLCSGLNVNGDTVGNRFRAILSFSRTPEII